VRCTITKPDGSTVEFLANHTFSPEQIDWFKAGGALNIIRQKH
jgi:aconitate hydratase